MPTDLIIDFETLDTEPTAVVLSCCIIPFTRDEVLTFQEYVDSATYWNFEVDHQVETLNRTYSVDTIKWWKTQDKEVYESQLHGGTVSLFQFVNDLKTFVERHKIDKSSMGFCRGQSFDFPILSDIIKSVDSSIDRKIFPVPFYNQRDTRSYISGLFGDANTTKIDVDIPGFKAHDPIHDCAKDILMIKKLEQNM